MEHITKIFTTEGDLMLEEMMRFTLEDENNYDVSLSLVQNNNSSKAIRLIKK